MFTYCLFCETAKCGYVAYSAEKKYGCRAISPKQVQHTWSKGKMADIEHDLLPGYVFLYSENRRLRGESLRTIEGVIRCLADLENRCELSGSDEQFALMLLQSNGVIGKTKVYQEGSLIRICQGVYEGVEARILKVNHRNTRMQIEIPFASQKIRTWVEYEIVELKDEEEEDALEASC